VSVVPDSISNDDQTLRGAFIEIRAPPCPDVGDGREAPQYGLLRKERQTVSQLRTRTASRSARKL